MCKLSIITACYNSQNYIENFIKKILKTLEPITNSFEIIIVDDGSTDNSDKVLSKISENNKNIKVVFLKKNYGQATAIYEGIKISRGQYFYTTDIDLEVDEKYLQILYNNITSGSKECIFCLNEIDNSKSLTSKIFKKIFFIFSKIFLENSWMLNVNSTFIATDKCRDRLKKINFNNKNLSVLIHSINNKDFIKINRSKEIKETSYTLEKRFQIALDFFILGSKNFFSRSILLISISFIFSIFFLFYHLTTLILNDFFTPVPGYFSLLALIILFGSLSTFFGFLSFYIALNSKRENDNLENKITKVINLFP